MIKLGQNCITVLCDRGKDDAVISTGFLDCYIVVRIMVNK
jgi:hypothetical protein